MYVSDAITQLGLRVEDADKKKFPEKLRRQVLEYSQVKIANMLHNAYLTELECLETGLTASGRIYTIKDLKSKVLRGGEGILKVKLTGGRYCTRIALDDLKKLENTYLAGTDDNPLFYVFQDKIYIKCTATSPVIDVYYLRLPSPLYYPFTTTGTGEETQFWVPYFVEAYADDYFNGSLVYIFSPDKSVIGYYVVTDFANADNVVTISPPAPDDIQTGHHVYFLSHPTVEVGLIGLSDTAFDLNDSLADLIVDYAESELWKITADIERRNSTMDKVITQIKALNDKYRESDGIGTKQKGAQ